MLDPVPAKMIVGVRPYARTTIFVAVQRYDQEGIEQSTDQMVSYYTGRDARAQFYAPGRCLPHVF